MDDGQLGFDLGETARPKGVYFDADDIREDALALLATARSATANTPWDAAELKYQRIAFPYLVSWLPDQAERDQLWFDFAREIERIERLIAA